MKATMRLGFVLAAAMAALPSVAEVPFTWKTNADKTITITDYTGDGGEVAIPERINGLQVASIGKLAFLSCTGPTSVAIPNGVTSIDPYAFSGCRNLTNVMIPASVTSIGSMAFALSTNLTAITVDARNPAHVSVGGVLFDKEQTTLVQCPEGKTGDYSIPNGVTNVGEDAFYYCPRLTSVAIPNSVASIGPRAFAGCGGLTNVAIGNGVTRIGSGAFYGCIGLKSVTIPSGVTSIGAGVFSWCTGLTAITVDRRNPVYRSSDGALFGKNLTTLLQCPGGKTGSYSIPASVASIGDDAFNSCTGLTNVTIGPTVTSIGYWAFSNCTNLTSVHFKGNAPSLGEDVFDHADKVAVYYLPGTKGWGPTFGGRPTAVWKPEGGVRTNVTPVVGTQR